MVKNKSRRKRRENQERKPRIKEIGSNTPYGTCSENMSSFGGLLLLVKFLDLLKFEEVFEDKYVSPVRQTKLGCYRMVLGMLILLFTGFQRLRHFVYIREDSIICGILKVARLPDVSTFWRYLQSLRVMQSQALLRIMAVVRGRVWRLLDYRPKRVSVNIDTTVATVYGKIEGSQKGYNPRHRGKKGLRPVFCFIQETREYLCGKQRRGQTINRAEVAKLIKSFKGYLPGCVEQVLVRADEEFVGWESVQACVKCGYEFIFASSGCNLPITEEQWYSCGDAQYAECRYRPKEWKADFRFVVMRSVKESPEELRLSLLDNERYIYRMFVTNLSSRPHEVIAEYDKRADVENLIGEAQHEGILAIPSKRFQSHHAFFQIVMLAYNLWRWLKLKAEYGQEQTRKQRKDNPVQFPGIASQTLRIARLKMLYISAKVTFHSNRDNIYYSIHDNRTAGIQWFLKYLDQCRSKQSYWPQPRGQTA